MAEHVYDGPHLAGRYRLGHVLGRGGAGEVRAAWDTLLARPVAVKLVPGGDPGELGSRQRLRTEALAAARLNCPQVVALFDYGSHEHSPFLVMERLSGTTWADELRERRPTPARVMAVVDNVLAGLDAAHQAGIVHRDVKPSNVLLTGDGEAKLADFGIALTADLSGLTLGGTVLGTVAYMAPERFTGTTATPASDVWSVGVLLYEGLAGRRPFTADSPAEVAAAAQRGRHLGLRQARPELPAALCRLVETAMSTDSSVRPSAADLRAALREQAAAGSAVVAPLASVEDPEAATARLAVVAGAGRRRSRAVHPALAVALAGVVAVVGAVALDGGSGIARPDRSAGAAEAPGTAAGTSPAPAGPTARAGFTAATPRSAWALSAGNPSAGTQPGFAASGQGTKQKGTKQKGTKQKGKKQKGKKGETEK